MIDMQDIRSQFRTIKKEVNSVIGNMDKENGSWADEPINWARIRCLDVEYIIDDNSEWYRATVRGASPRCPSFVKHISDNMNFDYGVVLASSKTAVQFSTAVSKRVGRNDDTKLYHILLVL